MPEAFVFLRSDSNYLQPVPLTDEVLISFGFKFETYCKLWQKMKKVYGTGIDMEITNDYTVLDFSHHPISKEIEYLHHLQNLFYALKREELTFEPIINHKSLSPKEVIS